MAKHLHFHVLDPGYILLLVSEHPRIIAAGLQHKVIRASLIHSNLARRTDNEGRLAVRGAYGFARAIGSDGSKH
jgi:hypothetical protein